MKMSERSFNVVFSHRPGNIASWLIKRVQKTPFSHVCIQFKSNVFGCQMIYEAAASGVRLVTFDNWLQMGNVPVHFVEKQWDECRFQKTLKEKVGPKLGKAYGKLTLLGIAIGDQELGVDGGKTFICSELAYDFLEDELGDLGKVEDKITPLMMYDAVT